MVIRPKSIATVVVVLRLHPGQVVDADARVGQVLLGAQRPDLADRADQGGLADPEAAGDQDLDRGGQCVASPPAGQRARSPSRTALNMRSSGMSGRGAGARGPDEAPVEQVAEQDPDGADRQVEVRGDLGDRDWALAQPDDRAGARDCSPASAR